MSDERKPYIEEHPGEYSLINPPQTESELAQEYEDLIMAYLYAKGVIKCD